MARVSGRFPTWLTKASVLACTGAALIAVAYVWLRLRALSGTQIITYPDTYSYLGPTPYPNRAFTIPFLFALLRGNFVWIWGAQFTLACVSWLALALAVYRIAPGVLKLPAPLIVLALSLSGQLVQWDRAILSESFSFSLMALVAAVSLLVYRRYLTEPGIAPGLYVATAILWAPLLFLMANTRDTHIYLMPLLIPLAAVLVPRHADKWPYVTAVVIAIIGIAAAQNLDANRGLRWEFPLQNVIIMRVLPDRDLTRYFVEHGMPYNERIQALAGPRSPAKPLQEQKELLAWIRSRGKSVYQTYLITHPVQTNLDLVRALPAAFAGVTYVQTPSPLPQWLDDRLFFPVSQTWTWLVGMALWPLVMLGAFRKRRTLGFVALWLFVIFYTQAFVAYYGDAQEVQRHSLTANLLFRCTMLVDLFCLLVCSSDLVTAWVSRYTPPPGRYVVTRVAPK